MDVNTGEHYAIYSDKKCQSHPNYIRPGDTGNCYKQFKVMLCDLVSIHNSLPPVECHKEQDNSKTNSTISCKSVHAATSFPMQTHHRQVWASSIQPWTANADAHTRRTKSGTAESCGSRKCCLQQGCCVWMIDSTGTTQHNVLWRSSTCAEEPTHPRSHQASTHPWDRWQVPTICRTTQIGPTWTPLGHMGHAVCPLKRARLHGNNSWGQSFAPAIERERYEHCTSCIYNNQWLQTQQ